MSKQAKPGLGAYILDNLWIWLAVTLVIMFVYGAWALIEALTMHSPQEIPPVPA
ncbi:MAG: response regulator [Desulfurococcales archaeon]|nr:response regulator [Desulfurococcales archaeon]